MEEASQLLGAPSEPGRSLLTEPIYSYGGRQNPYDQREGGGGGYNAPRAPYPSGGGGAYNMPQPGAQQPYSPSYNQPAMGRDNYGRQGFIDSSSVESLT